MNVVHPAHEQCDDALPCGSTMMPSHDDGGMVRSANLGFQRVGAKRELKAALERFWRGDADAKQLHSTAASLRARHWRLQRDAGLDVIPSNDFSLYDHVLDTTVMVGAVPARFAEPSSSPAEPLVRYFAMARGLEEAHAMEMTKWFDTNYHYLVPELAPGQRFHLAPDKPLNELAEAHALGIETRPVLLGPVTFLSLGKAKTAAFDPLSLVDELVPVYAALLEMLRSAGASSVQIDEPVLALDLNERHHRAFTRAYAALRGVGPPVMLATYFGPLLDNAALAASLPVSGLHVDVVRAPEQLDDVLTHLGDESTLSLGLVDGRNVWRTDLRAASTLIEHVRRRFDGDRLQVAPSCSLLHVPFDVERETRLAPELHGWLAFAKQKLEELVLITRAANGEPQASEALERAERAHRARAAAAIHDAATAERVAALDERDYERTSPFAVRRLKQAARLRLPALPTTTVGSFPQTAAVRRARAAFKRGELDAPAYAGFLERETERCVRAQESLGLDVLVHGELERNDMVEYFGEQLAGYAVTEHGWVQSYGSRCVKPPIVYGDVSRPKPLTVGWSTFAQALTSRPMKGMLTGPVTMLQWSFVRDDRPRWKTCTQIALALRDEVRELEAAGIGIVQIDEPALREGLPLRRRDWPGYLTWAIRAFRLAAGGVRDETQIHTHMCYSEFDDIMDAIAALDADVISIESSRSDMELLDGFAEFAYPNGIGPGVWDIHSPRVPSTAEMLTLLRKAVGVFDAAKLWVNPDCGLKTRNWSEVGPALANMVRAAKALRDAL